MTRQGLNQQRNKNIMAKKIVKKTAKKKKK